MSTAKNQSLRLSENPYLAGGMFATCAVISGSILHAYFYYENEQLKEELQMESQAKKGHFVLPKRKRKKTAAQSVAWGMIPPFLVSMGVLATGSLLVWRKGHIDWRRRHFLNRINFSLNTITPDRFLLSRTLFERSMEQVFFQNAWAKRMFLDAIAETDRTTAFLPLPKGHCWYILNAVMNELAPICADGNFRNDFDHESVIRVPYLFGISYEHVQNKKLRVIVVQAETLRDIANSRKKKIPYLDENSAHHHSNQASVRWNTMKEMAELYKNGQLVTEKGVIPMKKASTSLSDRFLFPSSMFIDDESDEEADRYLMQFNMYFPKKARQRNSSSKQLGSHQDLLVSMSSL